MMYMTPGDEPAWFLAVPRAAGFALVVSAVLVFYLGILPTRVLDWAAAGLSGVRQALMAVRRGRLQVRGC